MRGLSRCLVTILSVVAFHDCMAWAVVPMWSESHVPESPDVRRKALGWEFSWARELELWGWGVCTVENKRKYRRCQAWRQRTQGWSWVVFYMFLLPCFLFWDILTLVHADLERRTVLTPATWVLWLQVCATTPDTCCFQILTESVLGSPDLTLVYVQGVDGCVCGMWWQLLFLLRLCRFSGSSVLLTMSPDSQRLPVCPGIPGTSHCFCDLCECIIQWFIN